MKFTLITMVVVLCIFSCRVDKNTMKTLGQVSTLKSDVLIQIAAYKPFSRPERYDGVSLTISGKSIVEGIATFKVVNDKGEELHCETFPSKELMQPEYRTANAVLQEAHIRDVVEGFFMNDHYSTSVGGDSYAGL